VTSNSYNVSNPAASFAADGAGAPASAAVWAGGGTVAAAAAGGGGGTLFGLDTDAVSRSGDGDFSDGGGSDGALGRLKRGVDIAVDDAVAAAGTDDDDDDDDVAAAGAALTFADEAAVCGGWSIHSPPLAGGALSFDAHAADPDDVDIIVDDLCLLLPAEPGLSTAAASGTAGGESPGSLIPRGCSTDSLMWATCAMPSEPASLVGPLDLSAVSSSAGGGGGGACIGPAAAAFGRTCAGRLPGSAPMGALASIAAMPALAAAFLDAAVRGSVSFQSDVAL
jgi:hypothetical protein